MTCRGENISPRARLWWDNLLSSFQPPKPISSCQSFCLLVIACWPLPEMVEHPQHCWPPPQALRSPPWSDCSLVNMIPLKRNAPIGPSTWKKLVQRNTQEHSNRLRCATPGAGFNSSSKSIRCNTKKQPKIEAKSIQNQAQNNARSEKNVKKRNLRPRSTQEAPKKRPRSVQEGPRAPKSPLDL